MNKNRLEDDFRGSTWSTLTNAEVNWPSAVAKVLMIDVNLYNA